MPFGNDFFSLENVSSMNKLKKDEHRFNFQSQNVNACASHFLKGSAVKRIKAKWPLDPRSCLRLPTPELLI